MISPDIASFLQQNHNGVLTTFRRNGAAQMSVITCGLIERGVAFSTTHQSAKFLNLRRDLRCTLLVSAPNWRTFVVLEGEATIMSDDQTDPEELRLTLRDVYKAAAGKDHPDWNEYDRAMVLDKRVTVIVIPSHIYGRH